MRQVAVSQRRPSDGERSKRGTELEQFAKPQGDGGRRRDKGKGGEFAEE